LIATETYNIVLRSSLLDAGPEGAPLN